MHCVQGLAQRGRARAVTTVDEAQSVRGSGLESPYLNVRYCTNSVLSSSARGQRDEYTVMVRWMHPASAVERVVEVPLSLVIFATDPTLLGSNYVLPMRERNSLNRSANHVRFAGEFQVRNDLRSTVGP